MAGKVRLKSMQEKLIWAEAVPFHGLCPWSATDTSSLPASRFWHSWKYLYLKVKNYTLFSANQVTKPVSCCLHTWWDLIPANLLADEAQIAFSYKKKNMNASPELFTELPSMTSHQRRKQSSNELRRRWWEANKLFMWFYSFGQSPDSTKINENRIGWEMIYWYSQISSWCIKEVVMITGFLSKCYIYTAMYLESIRCQTPNCFQGNL